MESHEEKVYKAMRETQEKEAKLKMLERAEEIRRAKMAEKQSSKSSYGGSHSGGFGSSSNMYNSSSSSSFSHEPSSYEPSPPSFSSSSASQASKPSSSTSKAMKLGTNKDALPAFIEQQAKQALPAASQSLSSSSSLPAANQANVEKVHVKIDEKVNLTCGKDGGVQNLEVLGVLSVRIASEDEGKIKIAIRNGDTRNLQIQVNLFKYLPLFLFRILTLSYIKDKSKRR